jgi:hypothetical protein
MFPLASADAPVIMLGCQRSGTTLTAQILASHPRSGFGSELGVIRFALIWFRRLCDSPAAFRNLRMVEFLHAFRRTGGENGGPEHQRLFANVKQTLAMQIRSGRLETWAANMQVDEFIRALCFESHTRNIEDLSLWGDKYPEFLFHLEELAAVFPEARYLFIHRQPGDVMESLFRHRNTRRGFTGSLRFTMADCRDQWVSWNRLWQDFKETIPEQRRFELPFEELAREPEAVFVQLEEFLGVSLLDSKDLQALVRRIDADQVEKWRRMPAAHLVSSCPATEEFNAMCSLYGYEAPTTEEMPTPPAHAFTEGIESPSPASEEADSESGAEQTAAPPTPGTPVPIPPSSAPGDVDAPDIGRNDAKVVAAESTDAMNQASEVTKETAAPVDLQEADDAATEPLPAIGANEAVGTENAAAGAGESTSGASPTAATPPTPETGATQSTPLPSPPPIEALLRGPALLRPEAVGNRPKVKLLVIGLDGMTPNVLFPELPRLESFKSLVARGSHGPLASVSPPMSGCAWPSFFTGLEPRRHGFDENQRRFEDMSYLDVRATKVWEMLNASGISTGFLNMPLAYQVDPLLGYIVPGRFAPLQRMTPEVRNTLQGYRAHPRIAPQTTAEFLREQWETDRQCIHYWEKLVHAHPTDLATVVLYTPDNVGHWFWDDASAVHDSYALLDQLLGRILNAVDAENVLIMSDHGMQGKTHPDTDEFARVLDGKGETVHHQMQGWHQKAGVYVATGSAFSHHADPRPLSLVDLTPIMLNLFGLTPPPAVHFDGETPTWLMVDESQPREVSATSAATGVTSAHAPTNAESRQPS